MPKTYDDSNTKMSIEIETGKQVKDPSKEWEGIRVRIGDVSRVLFVTKKEMAHVKKVLEANK